MIAVAAFRQSTGFRLFVAVTALSCVGSALFPAKLIGGFSCGALAFCLAAVSLEQIARKALQLGDVRGGVRSGFLWVILKFFGPAAAIFYGIWRDFSPAALMAGIFSSLALFVVIVWFSHGRGVVGPKV